MHEEIVRVHRPPQKRAQSKMSPLAASGLSYEYIQNLLDDSRRSAFEKCIEDNPKARKEFESARKGALICDELVGVQVQAKLVKSIAQTENLQSLLKAATRISGWPDVLKWSSMGVLISLGVAMVIGFIPWQKVSWLKMPNRNVLVLSTVPSSQMSEAQLVASKPASQSRDDSIANQVAAAKLEPEKAVVPPASGTNTDSSAPVAPAPVLAAVPVAPAAPAEKPVAAIAREETVRSDLSKPAAVKGFVYRTFVRVEEVDQATEQIRESVLELGGQKAGEVELGWRKKQGSYFHFSIPEENYDQLVDKLKMIGSVQSSKDSHPRVMPKGTVRFILWVETKKDGSQ